MNACERLAALDRGEQPDRLPCVPIVANTAARVAGCAISDFRDDGRRLAQAHVAAYRRFGHDLIRLYTDLFGLAEAMGATVEFPRDDSPRLAAPAVRDVSAIDTLRPADPKRHGRLPVHLEAAARCLEAVGGEVPVTSALAGPLTTASLLIGEEVLIRLMDQRPEVVHRLCALALESGLAYAQALLDLGCTPSLTDFLGAVVRPEQFREFAKPYLTRLIAAIKARPASAVVLHICGKTDAIWPDMADTGADWLSIDEANDLGQAKTVMGDRVRLMGNVAPGAVMLDGTPEDVRRAVRVCVAKAHDAPGGLVVATGCSLSPDTPFANIDAMMRAVDEIGWPVRIGSVEDELSGRS